MQQIGALMIQQKPESDAGASRTAASVFLGWRGLIHSEGARTAAAASTPMGPRARL
jgi:hypothetical protein